MAREIIMAVFSRPREIRVLFPSASKIPAWLLTEAQPRSICRLGKQSPVFSRPREIRVLSQEDWLAHHWLVLLLEKCETKTSCLCVASATMEAQVVRGRPVQNPLIDFFPPAIVNSQIAQVERPKIAERMVFGSSPLLSGVCYFFSLSNWGHRQIRKSFRGEIMKKIPDIINRLWNVVKWKSERYWPADLG